MYVFFGIVSFISYIFVLLHQEEDGAVAITLERRAWLSAVVVNDNGG